MADEFGGAPVSADDFGGVPLDPDEAKIQSFKESHPMVYGALKGVFNTAEPMPGIMALEGPVAQAVETAARGGLATAGDFISKLFAHPKVVQAMKDQAMTLVKEIPMVKSTLQTGKTLNTIRDVAGDILHQQAMEEIPTIAPKATPGIPKVQPIDQALANLRTKLENKGWLKPGYNLGEEPHGSYPERFDEGSGAPTVQSVTPKIKVVKTLPSSAGDASTLAKVLHTGGITSEQAGTMTKDQWGMAAKAAGLDPSMDSEAIKRTLFELGRRERAMAAAKALQSEMTQ